MVSGLLGIHAICAPGPVIEFHFLVEDGVLVGDAGGGAFGRFRGGELVVVAHYFEEFAAAELEVDLGVILEDVGVIGFCVFEGFVNVAVEDGGADFWGC